jgi:hypothetical protein
VGSQCSTDAHAYHLFRLLQASPLQCSAIADSCLAMGAATCRAAAAAINKAIQEQQLGPKAAGGKVSHLSELCVVAQWLLTLPCIRVCVELSIQDE